MTKNYFDLTINDIDSIAIIKDGYYNCMVKSSDGQKYDGFILAKSQKGNALTICEIDFQKSPKDQKYHPRLTFKRTDPEFKEKNVTGEKLTQRISFQKGADGYREFWRLVSFLNGFSELIDIGEFKSEYRVATRSAVVEYIAQNPELEPIIEQIHSDSASAFHYLTTIKLLESYRAKIEEFIISSSSETVVQKWIDEDNHKHRQDRCMIFGLEFVNHKREGGVNGNNYDVLTRIGIESEERVLIELKSPSDEIFEVRTTGTINDAKKEYSLSKALARAIPQILEYREDLEQKYPGDSELQKIGEDGRISISKCVILVGHNKTDVRWKKNLKELRRSLSANLEIWTYTDLLNKIDSVIRNLKRGNQV